jgi:hypothetical protein
MPAVVRPAAEAIGRGGHPSHYCHTCVSVAGIHLVAVIPAVSGGYPFKENATWIPDKGRRE